MSQPQHTYTLRKEIGFGVELAMSHLGRPHEIQIEDSGGAYDLQVITTTDPLASLRAATLWTILNVTPGVLTTIPAGVRKLAVSITAINNADAPAPTVFHMPGFFRGAEQARYYGVDQLDAPAASPAPPIPAPLPGTPFANFDLSDLSTLFQSAGTGSPVTTNGQTIHHIVDKQGNMADANPNFGSSRIWDSAFGGIGGGDLVASTWISSNVPNMSNGEWTILVVLEMQSDVNGGWWSYAGVPNLGNFTVDDHMGFATASGDLVWDGVGEETPYSTLLGLIIQADASSLLGYRSDLSGSKLPDAAWVFEELDGVGAMGIGPLAGSITWGQLILWDSQPTIPSIKNYAADKWSFAWA